MTLDNLSKNLGSFKYLKRTLPYKGEVFLFPPDTKEVMLFTSTTNTFDFMPTYVTKDTLLEMLTQEVNFRLLCAYLAYSKGRHLIILKVTNMNPITLVIESNENTSGYVYAFYR